MDCMKDMHLCRPIRVVDSPASVRSDKAHPLLFVSRQIRQEVLLFLRPQREFVFNHGDCLSTFMRGIGIKQRSLVGWIIHNTLLPVPLYDPLRNHGQCSGWVHSFVDRGTQLYDAVCEVRLRADKVESKAMVSISYRVKQPRNLKWYSYLFAHGNGLGSVR
jgi:hypothetical protein